MKLTGAIRSRKLTYVYHGLLLLFIILCLVFIGGTVYAVFFQPAPPENIRLVIPLTNEGTHIFSGIGRLRIPTTDPQPGMVIMFVVFEYNPEDRPFSEELALRIGDFRNIVREYIGSLSARELRQKSEDTVRTELLRRFNNILRLGRIETLFFSDFIIVG